MKFLNHIYIFRILKWFYFNFSNLIVKLFCNMNLKYNVNDFEIFLITIIYFVFSWSTTFDFIWKPTGSDITLTIAFSSESCVIFIHHVSSENSLSEIYLRIFFLNDWMVDLKIIKRQKTLVSILRSQKDS